MSYIRKKNESDEDFEARKVVLRARYRAYYARTKQYQSDRQAVYYENNKQRLIAYSSRFQKENPVKQRIANKKLKAKRNMRVPCWYGELDSFVMLEAATLCEDRRLATGIDWHVDHMIPMNGKKASGLHVWNNIQCIPAQMNWIKGNKMIMTEPMQWMSYIDSMLI